jgi:hypothetical protein
MSDSWILQVHGEWSGIPEYSWMDIDMEATSLEEILKLLEKEVPKGVPYVIYDEYGDYYTEGTK